MYLKLVYTLNKTPVCRVLRGLTQQSSSGRNHWRTTTLASFQSQGFPPVCKRDLVLRWEQQKFYTITTRSVHTCTHNYLSDRLSWGSCCPVLHCTSDDPSQSSSPAWGHHSASHLQPSQKVGVLCWMDGSMALPSQRAILQAFASYGLLMNTNSVVKPRWYSHSLPEKHSLSKVEDKSNKRTTTYEITRWTFN